VRPAAVAELPERRSDVREREAKVDLRRGLQRVPDPVLRLRGRRGGIHSTTRFIDPVHLVANPGLRLWSRSLV
jgi:hypothetical protein